jgi:hypothetical protein
VLKVSRGANRRVGPRMSINRQLTHSFRSFTSEVTDSISHNLRAPSNIPVEPPRIKWSPGISERVGLIRWWTSSDGETMSRLIAETPAAPPASVLPSGGHTARSGFVYDLHGGLMFRLPQENRRAAGNRTMTPVPSNVALGFVGRFLLPLKGCGSVFDVLGLPQSRMQSRTWDDAAIQPRLLHRIEGLRPRETTPTGVSGSTPLPN